MKKRILSFVLVLTLGFSLCACDGVGTDNPNGDTGSESGDGYNPLMFEVPEGGYDGSAVSITVGFAGDWDFLDKYVEQFNKLYPNIEVIVEEDPEPEDIYDRIIFQKGNWLPNVVFCLPDQVAEYRLTQWVIALDNLINHPEVGFSQEELDDFVEAFYNQGKEYGDGDIYSLPVGRESDVLFYNKTFFDQHQLKVPTTWAEMEAVCEQIKSMEPQSVPLGCIMASNCFVTMSKQLGSGYTSSTGEHYLFDNEENHTFTKKLREWYKKGYLHIRSQDKEMDFGGIIGPINQSGDATYQFRDEVDNKCYMVIAPASYASVLSPSTQWDGTHLFEAGVAMVPQYDVNNPKVSTEGPDVCIMRNENPQEVMASWLFVKFLETNKEFQVEYTQRERYMPVLKSAVEEPDFANRLASANGTTNLYMLAMKTCIEQQDAYFTLPAFQDSERVHAKVGVILIKAMGTDVDVETLFEEAMNELKK